MPPTWIRNTVFSIAITAIYSVHGLSGYGLQEEAPQPSIAKTGSDRPDPGLAVPKLTICDPVTFANCHKVAGVLPPRLIHSVDPSYPGVARRLRIQGMSVLQLVIDEKGVPQDVTIVKSITEKLPAYQRDAGLQMDANAVKAVKKFKFKPATLNGTPVPSQINIEQNYHLY